MLLIVDHGNNYMSLYGNAEALLKTKGDQVESGELIAEAGNSGARKESGIYFEIRHRGPAHRPGTLVRQQMRCSLFLTVLTLLVYSLPYSLVSSLSSLMISDIVSLMKTFNRPSR